MCGAPCHPTIYIWHYKAAWFAHDCAVMRGRLYLLSIISRKLAECGMKCMDSHSGVPFWSSAQLHCELYQINWSIAVALCATIRSRLTKTEQATCQHRVIIIIYYLSCWRTHWVYMYVENFWKFAHCTISESPFQLKYFQSSANSGFTGYSE